MATDGYSGTVVVVGEYDDPAVEQHRTSFGADWSYSWAKKWGIQFSSSASEGIDRRSVYGIRLTGWAQWEGSFTVVMGCRELGVGAVQKGDRGAALARSIAGIVRSTKNPPWIVGHQFGNDLQGIIVTRQRLTLRPREIPGLAIYRHDLSFGDELSLVEMAALRLSQDPAPEGVIQFFVVQAVRLDAAFARGYPDTAADWALANCAFLRRFDAGSAGLPSHEMGHILLNSVKDTSDRSLMDSRRTYRRLSKTQFDQVIAESGPSSSRPRLLRTALSTLVLPVEEEDVLIEWPGADDVQVRIARAGEVIAENRTAVGSQELRSWAQSSSAALRFTAMRALGVLGIEEFFFELAFDLRLGLLALGGLERSWVDDLFARLEAEREIGLEGIEDGFQARRRVQSLRRRWAESGSSPAYDLISEVIDELLLGYDDQRDGLAYWDPARGGSPAVVWAEVRWRSLPMEFRVQLVLSERRRSKAIEDFLLRPRLANVLDALI